MTFNSDGKLTRRTFLASSAATAASLSIAASADAQARPIRIGLLGPGNYGAGLLRELEVVGPEFEAIATAVHRDSIDALQQQGIDAVIIATPDRLHAETAVAALESGLHVFSAPPMAMTEPDAATVRDVANVSEQVYRLGVESIHETRWQAARALVRSGVIGDVRWVSATSHALPADYQDGWKTDSRYTHGAAAHHLHELWTACAFVTGMGNAVHVSAMGGGLETDAPLPDGLCVSADFAGGGHFNLDCVPAPPSAAQATIRGSVASLVLCEESILLMPESRADAPMHEVWHGERAWSGSPLRGWLRDIRTGDTSGVDADLAFSAATGIAQAIDAYRAHALS